MDLGKSEAESKTFIHKGQLRRILKKGFFFVVKERIVGILGLAAAGCRTQGFTINHRQGRKRVKSGQVPLFIQPVKEQRLGQLMEGGDQW